MWGLLGGGSSASGTPFGEVLDQIGSQDEQSQGAAALEGLLQARSMPDVDSAINALVGLLRSRTATVQAGAARAIATVARYSGATASSTAVSNLVSMLGNSRSTAVSAAALLALVELCVSDPQNIASAKLLGAQDKLALLARSADPALNASCTDLIQILEGGESNLPRRRPSRPAAESQMEPRNSQTWAEPGQSAGGEPGNLAGGQGESAIGSLSSTIGSADDVSLEATMMQSDAADPSQWPYAADESDSAGPRSVRKPDGLHIALPDARPKFVDAKPVGIYTMNMAWVFFDTCEEWTVERRFSQFAAFRDHLYNTCESDSALVALPEFPTKSYWYNSHDPTLMESRRVMLQHYMQEVVKYVPGILDDSRFHEFLGTDDRVRSTMSSTAPEISPALGAAAVVFDLGGDSTGSAPNSFVSAGSAGSGLEAGQVDWSARRPGQIEEYRTRSAQQMQAGCAKHGWLELERTDGAWVRNWFMLWPKSGYVAGELACQLVLQYQSPDALSAESVIPLEGLFVRSPRSARTARPWCLKIEVPSGGKFVLSAESRTEYIDWKCQLSGVESTGFEEIPAGSVASDGSGLEASDAFNSVASAESADLYADTSVGSAASSTPDGLVGGQGSYGSGFSVDMLPPEPDEPPPDEVLLDTEQLQRRLSAFKSEQEQTDSNKATGEAVTKSPDGGSRPSSGESSAAPSAETVPDACAKPPSNDSENSSHVEEATSPAVHHTVSDGDLEVERLCDLFPMLDPLVVVDVFAHHHGDVEAVTQQLTEMNPDQEAETAASTEPETTGGTDGGGAGRTTAPDPQAAAAFEPVVIPASDEPAPMPRSPTSSGPVNVRSPPPEPEGARGLDTTGGVRGAPGTTASSPETRSTSPSSTPTAGREQSRATVPATEWDVEQVVAWFCLADGPVQAVVSL